MSTIQVVQETLPQDAATPAIHLQLTFLYPSQSLMLWASTGATTLGAMTIAMPAANAQAPLLKTRVTGLGANDHSDRLATLLGTDSVKAKKMLMNSKKAQKTMLRFAQSRCIRPRRSLAPDRGTRGRTRCRIIITYPRAEILPLSSLTAAFDSIISRSHL